ncbi:hypothetical protein [Streptomyces sp. ISL-11]|uniref:hypothetical protein n=1 Tax=Streptomyces sp. ISL-11 TaxID=2819174 RepID=UPI001BE72A5B|nr:hypothetical protein [Streptomyces sp. ISL-11]MBT2383849.1 hypothetical protein [Streptomyces sp. ISL-11]
MTTEYIVEKYPEEDSFREFWVTTECGIRHTLELGLDADRMPIAVWSSDAVSGAKEWETQGLMPISPAHARQMIGALERILREAE